MGKKSSKSKADQEEEKPVIEKKASKKVEKSPKKDKTTEKRSEKDKSVEKSPKKSKSPAKSPKKDKAAKKAEKAERKAKKAEKRTRAVQEETEVADDDDDEQSEAVFEADGDTDSIFSSEVAQSSETTDIDLAALLKAHEQSKRDGRKQQREQSQKKKKKGAHGKPTHDEDENEDEDDEEDDDDDEEQGAGEKKTKKISQRTQQEERTRRTLFLGNLPVETKPNQVKRLFDSLKATPTQRIIESVRFRSFATAKANSNRKLAFIKKEFHSKRGSLNAYVVFVTEELAHRGLEVIQKADPPVMMAANRIRADLATPPSGLVAAGVAAKPAAEQPLPKRTLFVGNVPFECEDDWMIQHFVRAGAMVESVRLIRDGATGLGKGFGYVTFKQDTDIEIALRTKDKPFKIPNSDHTRLLRILTCKPSKQSASTAGRLLDDNRKSGSRTVDEAQRRKLKKLKDTHLKKKEAKDQARRAEARDRGDQQSEDRGRKRSERSDDSRDSRKRFERSDGSRDSRKRTERSSSRAEKPAALFPWQGESAVLGEKDVLAHRKPKKSGGKKPRRK